MLLLHVYTTAAGKARAVLPQSQGDPNCRCCGDPQCTCGERSPLHATMVLPPPARLYRPACTCTLYWQYPTTCRSLAAVGRAQ